MSNTGYAIPDFRWNLSPDDIKEARERQNMSQRDLAAAVGCTREAVKGWEKPGGPSPTKAIRRRLLEVLGLPVPSEDQDR